MVKVMTLDVFDPVLVIFFATTLLHMIIWIKAYINIRSSLSRIIPPSKRLHGRVRVSVIIPARNEEANLGYAIESILKQNINVDEIIIVDDNSTDRTGEIALKYASYDKRIIYTRIQGLPNGWLPKPHALYQGYRCSSGDVLVFIDADTRFTDRNALNDLVSQACQGGIVSYAPRFLCPTRICRVVEVVLTTLSHAFTGFNKVMDPSTKFAWFYGCCWAIKRDLYELIGTHSAVKDEAIEDKGLAERAKGIGVKITILRGWDRVETLWYGRLTDIINAISRILGAYKMSVTKIVALAVAIILIYMTPLLDIAFWIITHCGQILVIGALAYTLMTYVNSIGARLNRYNILYSLLCPIGGMLVAASAVYSIARKSIVWKGRTLS